METTHSVSTAPQTPWWSCSVVELIGQRYKNRGRAVPNTPNIQNITNINMVPLYAAARRYLKDMQACIS